MAGRITRRRLLRAGLGSAAAGLAGCSGGPAGGGTETLPETTPEGGGLPLRLEAVATGLRAPLGFEVPPDGGDRRYIVDQTGRIFVHGPDGLRDEPFLDVAGRIEAGGEKGLLGLAFHPEFGSNRRCYVRYSAPSRTGTPSNYSHTFVLAEFEATSDGRRAKPDTERTVLEIPEPQSNHNAGAIAFGPDGHLYVAVGDGGAGGDRGTGHVEDWYDANEGGNGQDVTENLLGSILRIDVDGREDGKPYGIPNDNPLTGGLLSDREGLPEHYAWGLRNPWRMSFNDGELFVGDVGQNRFEEVDIVEKGGNYGWNVKEGRECYGAFPCPDETPEGDPLIDPIVAYSHSGGALYGSSVIGGYVYGQAAIPALRGRYVFGDLQVDGRLFVATRPDDGGAWATDTAPIAGDDRGKLEQLFSFGRGREGDLYALGRGREGGGVYRLAPG